MENELLQCRGRNADHLASTLTEIDKMYDRKLQREIEKCHQNYHTQLSSSLASLRAYRQNQDRWHQVTFALCESKVFDGDGGIFLASHFYS